MSGYESLLKAVNRAMEISGTYLNVVSSESDVVFDPDDQAIPTLAERSRLSIESTAKEFAGMEGRSVENVSFYDNKIEISYSDKTKNVFTGFSLSEGSSIASYEYRDNKLIKFMSHQFDEDGNLIEGENGVIDASFVANSGKSLIDAIILDSGDLRLYYDDGTTERSGNIDDFSNSPIEDVEIIDGYLYFTVDGVVAEAMGRDEEGNPKRISLDGKKGEEGKSFYSEEERNSIKLIPPGYEDPETGARNNSEEFYIEIFNKYNTNLVPPQNWYGPLHKRVRILESDDVVNVRFRDNTLTITWPNSSEPLVVENMNGKDGKDSLDTDKSLFDGEFISKVDFNEDTKELIFHTNLVEDKWIVEIPVERLPSGEGSIDRVVSPAFSRMAAVIYIKIESDAGDLVIPVSLGRVRGWDGLHGKDTEVLIEEGNIIAKTTTPDRNTTVEKLLDVSYPLPDRILIDSSKNNSLGIRFTDGKTLYTEKTTDGETGDRGISFFSDSEKDSVKLITPGYSSEGNTNNSDDYFIQLDTEFNQDADITSNWYGPLIEKNVVLTAEDTVNVVLNREKGLTLSWPNTSEPLVVKDIHGKDGSDSLDKVKEDFDGKYPIKTEYKNEKLVIEANKGDSWEFDISTVVIPTGDVSIKEVVSPKNHNYPAMLKLSIDNNIDVNVSMGYLRGRDGNAESITIENNVLVDYSASQKNDLLDLTYPMPVRMGVDPLKDNKFFIQFDNNETLYTDFTADGRDGRTPRVLEESWDKGNPSNNYSLSFELIDSDKFEKDDFKNFMELRPKTGHEVIFNESNDQLIFNFAEDSFELDVTYGEHGRNISDDGFIINSLGQMVIHFPNDNSVETDPLPAMTNIHYDDANMTFTYDDGHTINVPWVRPNDGLHGEILKDDNVIFDADNNSLSITLNDQVKTYDNINTNSWPVGVTKDKNTYTVLLNDSDSPITRDLNTDGRNFTYISNITTSGRMIGTLKNTQDSTEINEMGFLRTEVRYLIDWYVDTDTNVLMGRFNDTGSSYEPVTNIPDFHKSNKNYNYFKDYGIRVEGNGSISIKLSQNDTAYKLLHKNDVFNIHGEKSKLISHYEIDVDNSLVTFYEEEGKPFYSYEIDRLNGENAINISNIDFDSVEDDPHALSIKIELDNGDEYEELIISDFHGKDALIPVNNPAGDNIRIDGNDFIFLMSDGSEERIEVPTFQGWQPRWIKDAYIGEEDRNFYVVWNDIGETSIGLIDGLDARFPISIEENDDEFFVRYNDSSEYESIGVIENFNAVDGKWIESFAIAEDSREMIVTYNDENIENLGFVDGSDAIFLQEFFERENEFFARLSNESSSVSVGKVLDLHGKDNTWINSLGIENAIIVDDKPYVNQHVSSLSNIVDFGIAYNYKPDIINNSATTYNKRRFHVVEFSDNEVKVLGNSDTSSDLKYPISFDQHRTKFNIRFNDGEEVLIGEVPDINGIDATIITKLDRVDAYFTDDDKILFYDETHETDTFNIKVNTYANGNNVFLEKGKSFVWHSLDDIFYAGRADAKNYTNVPVEYAMSDTSITEKRFNGEEVLVTNEGHFRGNDGEWITGEFGIRDDTAFDRYGKEIDIRILDIEIGNEESSNLFSVGELDGRPFENEITDISLNDDGYITASSVGEDTVYSDKVARRRIIDVEIDEDNYLWIKTNYADPIKAGYVAGEDFEDGKSIKDIYVDRENEKLHIVYTDDEDVEVGDFSRTEFDFATISRDEGALFNGDLHIRLTDGKEFDLGNITGDENTIDIVEALVNLEGEIVLTRNQNMPTLRTESVFGENGNGIDKGSIVGGNLVFTMANGDEIDAGFVRRDLGFAPYDFLRTYNRGESATRDGRIYVALNAEVNTPPTMDSSEWAIVRFEDDPSPDAGRPDIIEPSDMEVVKNLRPYLVGSELRNYYSVDKRNDRIFSIDVEDGNFSNPVYETTENLDSHQVEMDLEVGQVYKWRMRDFVDTGYITDWSLEGFFTVIENSIQLPVVSEASGLDKDNMNIDAGFQSTPFVDTSGGTHVKSLWQIKRNSDDQIIVSQEQDTNLTSFVTPFAYLVERENYSVRVKYYTDDNESAFSDWFEFRTRAFFDFNFKPVVEFIGDNINATVARPAFRSKSELPRFYDEYMSNEDVEVFWEVYNSSGELVWSDNNRTFITEVRVGEVLESGMMHTIRVKYDSRRLRGHSLWSDPVMFTPDWYIKKPEIANDYSDLLALFYDTTFLMGDRTTANIVIDLDGENFEDGINFEGDDHAFVLRINGIPFEFGSDYDSMTDFIADLNEIHSVKEAKIENGSLTIVSNDRRISTTMEVEQFKYNKGYTGVVFADEKSTEEDDTQVSISIDLLGHDNWEHIDFDNGDNLTYTISDNTVSLSGEYTNIDDILTEIESDENIESAIIEDGKLVITTVTFDDPVSMSVSFEIQDFNDTVDITENATFNEPNSDVWEGRNDSYISHDWEIRRMDDDRLVYGKFADFEREVDWEVNFDESDSLQAYYARVRVNGIYGRSEWSDHLEFVLQEIIFTNIYLSTSSGHVVRLDQSGSEVWNSRPSTSSINNVVVNDNREVFAASSDNRVYKIDDEGDVVWSYSGFSNDVNAVSYYDGGLVAAGSSDNSVAVLKSETGEEVWRVTEHTNNVNDVMFDLQGDVVSVSSDNTVIKYDGETGDVRWVNRSHSNNVNIVKIDKSGMIYTHGSDNTLRKINPRGFMEWSVTMSNVRDIGISFNERVYTIDSSGTIRIIDPEDGSIIRSQSGVHGSAGTGIEIDDNDEIISSTTSTVVNTDKDFDVRWNYNSPYTNITDIALNRQAIIVKPIGITGRFYELVPPENLVAF